jgi:starch-binding outer membrane protein, SusD/RagB family
MNTHTIGRGRWSLLRLTAVGGALAVALAACDVEQLMDIEDPSFAEPGEVTPAAGAAGAVLELQRAYSGAAANLHDEGYITVSAAMSDEWIAAGTFPTRIAIDRRENRNPSVGNHTDATYRWLHRARRAAREVRLQMEAEGTTTGAIAARLHAVEAFPYVALGEGWCGAVPISDFEAGQFIMGPMLSTPQLFEGAVERFDRAQAAVAPAAHHLSAVGKGRALLNLGRFADAAEAVAGVPTTFIHFFNHSNNSSIERNNIWALQDNGRWTLGNQVGVNGLPYRSSGDPRVPWSTHWGRAAGFDGSTPLFLTRRYAHTTATAENNAANVVLADGIEARLIEAEAALHGEHAGDWLAILNALRADYFSLMTARYGGPNYGVNLAAGVAAGRLTDQLPPLVDPGTHDARVDLLFKERAYWLYLTGHRLGDMRRLARAPYNRPVASIFPVGAYHKGGEFGNDVAFTIPFDEQNNTNFNPAACDTTKP